MKSNNLLTTLNHHSDFFTDTSLIFYFVSRLDVHITRYNKNLSKLLLLSNKITAILFQHRKSMCSNTQQLCHHHYKRRPRRPPFLRVLSEGIGVTSSATVKQHHSQWIIHFHSFRHHRYSRTTVQPME